jgi:hypothetical protein
VYGLVYEIPVYGGGTLDRPVYTCSLLELNSVKWNCLLDVAAHSSKNATMREAFTEQVRRAIRDCGETRYSLAKRIGIAQSTLSRFATGDRGLSMEALDRLFDALDLEIKPRKRKVK